MKLATQISLEVLVMSETKSKLKKLSKSLFKSSEASIFLSMEQLAISFVPSKTFLQMPSEQFS